MYIMYIDESGDTGFINSPTQYFILSGIVIHELKWREYLDQLIAFRKRMFKIYGLHLREEIHAAAFINRPNHLIRIPRHNRLAILRAFADELASMTDLNVFNVVVDKKTKNDSYDVFTNAWKTLFQRFENTMHYNNFHGPKNPNDKGMVIADNTDSKRLTQLLRRMRRYNPIPNQNDYWNITIRNIIEDPNFRDSANSFFVQAADLIAYLLYQNICPNSYFKKKSAEKYFERLEPIICKAASKSHPMGIVFL